MFKEVHWYFNGTAFNKLVDDAGYNGIKDFAERSGIDISYKTIKRACDDSHCTKRTYYAVACKLAETLGWAGDPIAALRAAFTIFTTEPKYEEETPITDHEKLEQCIVYLSDGREALVQGKSIYWDWYDRDSAICFYDEEAEHGEGNGDLKIAEFNKACIMGIVRVIEE